MLQAFADCCDDITYADPRNDRADGFVMLNTYSSWCMYPVLTRQLKRAQALIVLFPAFFPSLQY